MIAAGLLCMLVAQAPVDASATRLDHVLAYARAHAPSLGPLAVREKRAGAVKDASVGAFFPENPDLAIAAGPRMGDRLGLDGEVGLSQRIELFGEQALRRGVAEAEHADTQSELAAARADVLVDIARSFHRLLVLRRRAALAERRVASAIDVAALADARARTGDGSALSRRLASSAVAEAEDAALVAQTNAAAEDRRVRALTAWPDDGVLSPLDDVREPAAEAELVARALANHPRVKALLASGAAARARLVLLEASAAPKPVVGVALATEGALRPGADIIARASVGLPLPLWQTRQAERARADAEVDVDAAELDLERTRLTAGVKSARAAAIAAAARTQLFEKNIVPGSADNLVLLKRSFELGELDLASVTTARDRLFASEARGLDALADYFAAMDDLDELTGALIE